MSVVIPAFNRAHVIARALASLSGQTYTRWEAVVVDDASSDGTERLIRDLSAHEPRIAFVRHETNKGAQAARNTGILHSRGEWITFLDADDFYLPASLEQRLAEAERLQVEVVHSEGLILRRQGDSPEPYGARALGDAPFARLLSASAMLFPTLLVSRAALDSIGALDETIVSFQEWDLAIRLARTHRVGFVAEATFVYDCTQGDSISKNRSRTAKGYAQIVRKHWRAILLVCGPRVLAHHFEVAARYHREAEEALSARGYEALARLAWPPGSVAGLVRRAQRMAQRYANSESSANGKNG